MALLGECHVPVGRHRDGMLVIDRTHPLAALAELYASRAGGIAAYVTVSEHLMAAVTDAARDVPGAASFPGGLVDWRTLAGGMLLLCCNSALSDDVMHVHVELTRQGRGACSGGREEKVLIVKGVYVPPLLEHDVSGGFLRFELYDALRRQGLDEAGALAGAEGSYRSHSTNEVN